MPLSPRAVALLIMTMGCGARTGLDTGDGSTGGDGLGGSGGPGGGATGGGTPQCSPDGESCTGLGECCGACVGGVCTTVLACTPDQMPTVLALDAWSTNDILEVDGEHVYYTRQDGVARVPKTGGSAELVVARSDTSFIASFALGPSQVYSTESTGGNGIIATSKAGLTSSVLVELEAGDTLRQRGEDLFWVRGPDDDRTILRVPVVGGSKEALAEHLANDAAGFLTDGSMLFYGQQTVNQIFADPIGAGPTYPLTQDTNALLGLDAGFVYFTEGSSLLRVGAAGGLQEVVENDRYPLSIGFDAQSVFLSSIDWSISRVSKSGGAVTPLYAAGGEPRSVTVDESCVYWFEADGSGQNTGRIVRAPK